MAKNYYMTKRPEGWAAKGEGARRASSVHHTQAEAEAAAKRYAATRGGGEVRVHDRQGRI